MLAISARVAPGPQLRGRGDAVGLGEEGTFDLPGEPALARQGCIKSGQSSVDARAGALLGPRPGTHAVPASTETAAKNHPEE